MNDTSSLLTFGGHLEVLRKMLFRIIGITSLFAAIIFYFKAETFEIILAPKSSDFVTFRFISDALARAGFDFEFNDYNVSLISTELSSQFMTHLSTSFMIGALLASPFILYELFRFIAPALYDDERRHSTWIALTIYGLFIIGVLMSYYIIFPISFRFLATYQVAPSITNAITLDSYISTFTCLTFMMGLVFELPVLVYVTGKLGFVDAATMRSLRPYAAVLILIAAAIITPPDVFTLIIVAIPLYALYELSILTLL